MAELGRALLTTPYLSTAVIAPVLLSAGPAGAAADLLKRIATGAVTVAVALGQDGADLSVSAQERGAGWSLTGHADLVIDGAQAELLLVPAGTDNV